MFLTALDNAYLRVPLREFWDTLLFPAPGQLHGRGLDSHLHQLNSP